MPALRPVVRLLQALATVAVLSALAAPAARAESATALVSTGWLKQHLKDPDLLVLDVRSAIDGGGAEGAAHRRPWVDAVEAVERAVDHFEVARHAGLT